MSSMVTIYFIMIIFICISTDIGGYIFGNLFKGPKLTKISPKKTYSGVIGGYLFSIIFMEHFLLNICRVNFQKLLILKQS